MKHKKKYEGLNLVDSGRQFGILTYADAIIILGLDSQEVKSGTKDQIKNSKDIRLKLN